MMDEETKAALAEMNRRLDYVESVLHEWVIEGKKKLVQDCPNCGGYAYAAIEGAEGTRYECFDCGQRFER